MIDPTTPKQYNSHTLWKAICSLEGSPFTTTGRRGSSGSRPGTPFSFTVSRNPSAGGRHYKGEGVDGYGNELWIVVDGVKRSKSISRSTVDRVYETVLEKGGNVPGPKSLCVYGASYIWPIFFRLGIVSTPDTTSHAHTAGEQQTDTAE